MVAPPHPSVIQLPSTVDRLMLRVECPHSTPALLFDQWTRPALVTRWWAQTADIQPRLGGAYQLGWLNGWRLRGQILWWDYGERLAFSWRWEHLPQQPTRTVILRFDPHGQGTQLMLMQGLYANTPDEQHHRAAHVEGWRYFLGRLQKRA